MALFKRGKTYWTHFFLNGQRFRASLHTTDWRKAQAAEKEFIALASEGKASAGSENFARLAFCEAADRYIVERALRISPRSVRTEKEHWKHLRKFFGSTPLVKIKAEAISQYLGERKAANAANRTINMERGILQRILKRAKRWHLVAEDFKPLPESRNVGRALRPEEKARLIDKAKSKPEWQVARLAMTLALNTTMRHGELLALRWSDVDFFDQSVTVRKSKTDAGLRVIPLNRVAMAAIKELWTRAGSFAGNQPDHFVFPTCEGYTEPDPTRPMKGFQSAWRGIRKAAGLPTLRFHDLRHHAITELAESEATDQTLMSIAGHVSQKMLSHYSHVRIEAKRKALDGLAGPAEDAPVTVEKGSGEDGYDTINDTIEGIADLPVSQLVDLYGGADGTRTRDLRRDRPAF